MRRITPPGTKEKHKKSIKIKSYFCHHYQVLLVNVLAEIENSVVDRPAVGTYRCDENENNVATMEVSCYLVRGLVRPHWDWLKPRCMVGGRYKGYAWWLGISLISRRQMADRGVYKITGLVRLGSYKIDLPTSRDLVDLGDSTCHPYNLCAQDFIRSWENRCGGLP